ncbi:MAG: hypothetical protein NZ959_10385 [Armatimonadetes bacterium]|nr:hypothetical protein [Armatimonadota bacterium]MDW8122702.1 hypothetical protein [Armatimonadota bacterium]
MIALLMAQFRLSLSELAQMDLVQIHCLLSALPAMRSGSVLTEIPEDLLRLVEVPN